jgi:hypothetical protein
MDQVERWPALLLERRAMANMCGGETMGRVGMCSFIRCALYQSRARGASGILVKEKEQIKEKKRKSGSWVEVVK